MISAGGVGKSEEAVTGRIEENGRNNCSNIKNNTGNPSPVDSAESDNLSGDPASLLAMMCRRLQVKSACRLAGPIFCICSVKLA